MTGANDILGDADKRRAFDRGEIDAAGEPRRPTARQYSGAGREPRTVLVPRDDSGFGDIFADIFARISRRRARTRGRGGFATKGRDVRYTLEVDFVEAVQGAKKRVTMPEGGVLDLAVPEGVCRRTGAAAKRQGPPGAGGGEAGDALVEIKVRAARAF